MYVFSPIRIISSQSRSNSNVGNPHDFQVAIAVYITNTYACEINSQIFAIER